MTNRGNANFWPLLFVVAIIAAAMLWALWPKQQSFEEATGMAGWDWWQQTKIKINLETERASQEVVDTLEKARIEAWIVEHKLNRYGDPADTVYAGGTPLFEEVTGKQQDRFEYIIKNHPERPWRD